MQIFGQIFRHAFGQNGYKRAISGLGQSVHDFAEHIINLSYLAGRTSTGGSINPVGRMTCSAKTPPDCSSLPAAGCGGNGRPFEAAWRSHSSKRSGRLSMQDGSRNPYSASVALRRKSPRYMPPICGTVTWLSSTKTSALSGNILKQCRRRFARFAPGQIA